MLTVKRAAERAGVSVSLIYSLCAEGRLPHIRLGR
jgi:excisionase family DNA binding protein